MKTKCYFCFLLLCLTSLLNAQSWHSLGAGLNGPVYEIYLHGEDVYAGGYFFDAGGNEDADYLARWDGCEWHAVAPGLNSAVTAIAVIDERVYVSGNFTDAGGDPDIDGIAFWDGIQWNALEAGVDYYVSDMEVIGSDLYVGGGFNRVGVEPICMIARWDGSAWHALGSGAAFCAYDFTYVSDIATDGVDLYVTGLFWDMGGIADADRIARWDGEMWHALGEGISPVGLWSDHLTLTVYQDYVYVAGRFTNVGNNAEADYLVSWDGDGWEGLVTSLADSTAFMPFIYQDALHAAFENEIRRLDQVGEWTVIAHVDGLYTVTSDEDNFYVGGFFNTVDSQQMLNIARWSELENCTTSLPDETSEEGEITTYPNPTSDMLSFDLDGANQHDLILSIYDTGGKKMMDTKTSSRQIDISSLYPGLYFISINDGLRAWRGKFVRS